MTMRTSPSGCWHRLRGEPFPALTEEPGPLSERHRRLATALELVRPEAIIGHVPLIKPHPRSAAGKQSLKAEAKRRKRIALRPAEHHRYQQRAAAERVFANFKDNFAGRMIRLRGPDKIACHIMFSLTALAAIQIMRLAQ